MLAVAKRSLRFDRNENMNPFQKDQFYFNPDPWCYTQVKPTNP